MQATLEAPLQEPARTGGQLATFHLAGLLFGVDVLRVQEVLRAQPMTPVPLAPEIIQGLINLRGQIVPALDMRRRLGLPARATGEPPMNMVIRTGDGVVSLLVDEIGDVLELDAAAFERPPSNLDPAVSELVQGVYKLAGSLLLLLDADRVADLSGGRAG